MNMNCDKCDKELVSNSGLAFSPQSYGDCAKYNLCEQCWEVFVKWLYKKKLIHKEGE